ncbi:MAG: circularly permuted type 2 ATP-grasp protein [Caldilineaceae bacterium]|nr:circularly permuted type 2 ATP-grasp protein [Caldilineaceae bacterium]
MEPQSTLGRVAVSTELPTAAQASSAPVIQLPVSSQASGLPLWLQHYQPSDSPYDEMWRQEGQIRPHWQPLMQMLAALGGSGMESLQQDVRRLIRENGVTYNVHGAADGLQRPWSLDMVPLIISEADWAVIEAGVMQRAELLNLILKDLYGPRKLLSQGLLPLELVYGHPGFLRACDGILENRERQLLVYAADLARGPDGRMWVLGDRTQAPSGTGYALENRTVMGTAMRSMFSQGRIQYLSNFFRTLHGTLAALSQRETPRIVLMTPGPYNETYFEHAYLAAYLGYTLVQGNDLTMVDGGIALKSLAGLQPVDVMLRRVDDTFCDPLELREDSYLGVTGLLEAVRRRKVAVANPLGSSVLENVGLMPFLPSLARHLLGEELILPTAVTRWCGLPKELNYVLDHLADLVIKPISRQAVTSTIFGNRLSRRELTQLRAQIKAQPYLYVGQEQVSFSTTPCFIEGKLEARHTVMRSFAVAGSPLDAAGYVVMPGGLTRSAAAHGDFLVSNSAGGISKDTWVLASQPQQHISLWQQASQVEAAQYNDDLLPSRAAENLFWVGRYTERAESTARLLRVIFDYLSGDELSATAIERACLNQLLRALTQVTMTYPGFVSEESSVHLEQPTPELLSLSLESTRIGSLSADLSAMLYSAYAIRDLWSIDTWRVINELEAPWNQLAQKKESTLEDVQRELNRLITELMALAGLHMESMIHSARWLLLDMGRRLERALRTIAFIRATLVAPQSQATQQLLLESVLKTTETIITYRRRYRANLQLQPVLELLLLDDKNPRALLYQLNQLQSHVSKLPHLQTPYRISQEEQLLLEAYTRLRLADTAKLARVSPDTGLCEELDRLMAELTALLSQLSNLLTQQYFTHTQSQHQFATIQSDFLTNGNGSLLEGK